MPTYGRIIPSLIAASLLSSCAAWIACAGIDGARAANALLPLVTKEFGLRAAPNHAVPRVASPPTAAKPVAHSGDSGTATPQPKAVSGQDKSKSGNQFPTEAAKPATPGPPVPNAKIGSQATAPTEPDIKIGPQATAPTLPDAAAHSEPAVSATVGSNPPTPGEPQTAVAAKFPAEQQAEPTAAPPGSPSPPSEAKMESAAPSGPVGNEALVPQLPVVAAPPSNASSPAPEARIEPPRPVPATKTQSDAAPAHSTASPAGIISPVGPKPSQHEPRMAEDQAPGVASQPNPSAPLVQPTTTPPPAGPSNPAPAPTFPLEWTLAAAALVLLILGFLAVVFGRGRVVP
jgi:hypothetical protein